MRVVIYGPRCSLRRAFAAGVSAHGDEVVWVDGYAFDPAADVAVVRGQHGPDDQVRRRHLKEGQEVLVLDMPPLRWVKEIDGDIDLEHGVWRKQLNGVVWGIDDGERWLRLATDPIQREPREVLVCGQTPRDAAHPLQSEDELFGWAGKTLAWSRHCFQGMPIVWRPHPAAKPLVPKGYDRISEAALLEDLRHAHCVVTYNSTSGVSAMRLGVPVIAEAAPCLPFAALRETYQLVQGSYPLHATNQMLRALSPHQWTAEEYSSGAMWASWRPVIERSLEEAA